MRIRWIDALRGLAVLLMVIDHMVVICFNINDLIPYRIITRLSYPIFVIISGYLINQNKPKLLVLSSSLIILLFALLTFPADYILNRKPNILFSIGIARMIAYFLPNTFSIPLFFMAPFDFRGLDYGILLTLSLIIIGKLFRVEKYESIIYFIVIFSIFGIVLAYPTIIIESLVLPFVLIIFLLFKSRNFTNNYLEFLGKHSLIIYPLHIYFLIIIRLILNNL